MKKSIFIMVAFFSFTVLFVSCKEAKKDGEKSEMHESHEHDESVATNVEFQCPMDCEKGKTYGETGWCPVCKMDLKENASEHAEEGESHEESDEQDESEEHDND